MPQNKQDFCIIKDFLMFLVVGKLGCMQDLHWSKKEKSQDFNENTHTLYLFRTNFIWSLVLDKCHWKFTENTQLGSFSSLLTRLVELGCEAESA